MIDLRLLISKGVHFGHQSWRRNPAMDPYIWGTRNGISLIDVSKTAYQLEKAAAFLKDLAAEGKEILWCGTKKAAQGAVVKVAEKTTSPYVAHRWIGGTLTNHTQVKKSVTKLLHLEDVLGKSSETQMYTKKELGVFSKLIERSQRNVGGIRAMTWPLGALIVVDVRKEHVAISEARDRGIPVVALIDTNSNPQGIAHVIPGNDDNPHAITCILEYLADAVAAGKAVAHERAVREGFEAAAKRAQVAETGAEEKSALQMQLDAVEASLSEGEARAATGSTPRGPAAPRSGARRPAGRGGNRPRPGGAKPSGAKRS